MALEHSRLLKFFTKGHIISEMAETPVIKIEKDYQSPPNVDSEVPGTQKIREVDDKNNSSDINTCEMKITGAEFTLSPVITVTKQESTLTKGDMKMQKVTVTEDIAVEETENGGHRVSREDESLTQTDIQTGNSSVVTSERENRISEQMEGEEKMQEERKSKIPMSRLRQVVERVKKERQAQKAREQPRRSSIPKLKDPKKAVKRDTSLKIEPKVDDEFDKIYEEIVDNKQKDMNIIDDKILAIQIEDPDKIETKFEEIIHAYDENEHEKQVFRISKIPALRRKDDGPSRIGALVDRVKEKNTESKLKDGGFKVTSSTIKTKRFSRGNSRDLSKEEQVIEVTETIDIKDSGDNEVFVKETVKNIPAKPERSRNTKRVIKDDHKVITVETIEHTDDAGTENVDRKDGVPHKSTKLTRVVNKEIRDANQNKDLSKKLADFRKKRFKNGIEDSVADEEFKDDVEENVEVKPERIVRDVSKEMNKDGQNITNTETVTVEDLKDGSTRTITTKTTVTESMKVGTPVVTEKIVRNISREISSEGQNDSIKGVVTTEETTGGGKKKITKETYVKENVKGIPVKTERFTRGFSREMGNFKQTNNKSKEAVSTEEHLHPNDDNKDVIKKEIMETEQIEKEGIKVGIPVYTKVTRSFSKGKIHNVEMSKSIEWKPADEVRTKKYSRSVSEKVTKKELKDAGNMKFEAPASAVKSANDKSKVETNITTPQNKTPTDPVIEGKIKDTVKDIAKRITINKVTEYKSDKQVTNVEENKFTLSKTVDLDADNDLKVSKEIGTQMSFEGKTVNRDAEASKEIGKQMSVEGKADDWIADRDFKVYKEIGTQMSREGKPVDSTVDNDNKVSREIGTQISVVGTNPTVDRELKISKEIGTQMSVESNKDIQKVNSDELSKEYATEITEDSIITSTVTEKSEKEDSNLLKQEKDSDTEEVTILKGNVSRLKDKITKEHMVESKKENDEELPKEKSILSKIAIFERLEPREPYPVIKIPTSKIKCKYVPPMYHTNNEEKHQVKDEVKEQTQIDSLGDTNKVEISVDYDDVTYTNEPIIVKEYWKTEEGYGQNVITEKTIILQEATSNVNQQPETNWETGEIIPETIDYRTEESQIEFTTRYPIEKQIKGIVTKSDGATLLPESIDINVYQSTTEGFEIVDDNNKDHIQKDYNQFEAPAIFPGKKDYEAEIGKAKPGKINLNKWNNQVEINKKNVDKIDAVRNENLEEIAKTLPGKVDLRTYESQIPVSKDLPGNIDFKKEENKVHITKGFEIKEVQYEVAHTLPERIDYKTEDSQGSVSDESPGNNDFKTHDYVMDDSKPVSEKIDNKTETKTEITTALPRNIYEVNTHHTKISKSLPRPETSHKEVAKPKPGKINLNLWKNQVEVNKTLVNKTGIKRSKELDIAKAFPGKVDVKTHGKPTKVTETLPGNNVFYKRDHKVEIAKTIPGHINFSNTESQIETVETSPAKILVSSQLEVAQPQDIEFSADNTTVEEIRTLPEEIIELIEIEFETYEAKAEIGENQDDINHNTTGHQMVGMTTLPGKLDFEKDESKVESAKPLPGKLDLKAWEHKVEVNKTLVDKLDIVRSENLEEIAKTLPGKIDFVVYESQVEEVTTPPVTTDFNSNENRVQITEADKNEGDIELRKKEYKVEFPSESDTRESLSDPELVDEDIKVEVLSNSIVGNIKKRLFFITNKNSVQSPSVSVVSDKRDNDYEKRVEELHNKTYSIKDIGEKQTNTMSLTSTTTENKYERRTESIEENDAYNTNISSAKEYELSFTTNTVHNEITRSVSTYGVHDIVTSPENYKRSKSLFESIEHKTNKLDNRNVTDDNTLNINSNKVQNETAKSTDVADESKEAKSVTEHNITDTFDSEHVTNENGFNFSNAKYQNELTRSAYGADDFKTASEDLKRTKSLAELDLGDVIHGQVRRMVGRIKSVDFSRRESIKTEINIKEMPKKMSVLEKIALFEGKASSTKFESTTLKTTVTKKPTSPVISEEAYLQKIEELNTGKTKFGRMESMLYLALADGNEIPVLAIGTALVDPRLLPHIIGAAIDMGYRAIDTAYIYGNEKEIGQAIKAKIDDGTVKREDLYIISKLWSTFHQTDLVEVACNASLKNLGLDYIDLYLIHNPMSFKEGSDPIPKIATVLQYSQSDYLDAWFGMERLVSKGLVKSIGVSNFNSQQIQRILEKGKVKPVVNQVECHPYLSQQRLHAFCTERHITLSCFGVLGSKGTPAEYKNSTTPVIDDALVKVMASGLGVSPAQLLIRYQIESGHNVVVKASSAAHLWDNLQALTFTLDQLQVDALNALNVNKRTFTFKGMGDTHKNYPFLASY